MTWHDWLNIACIASIVFYLFVFGVLHEMNKKVETQISAMVDQNLRLQKELLAALAVEAKVLRATMVASGDRAGVAMIDALVKGGG